MTSKETTSSVGYVQGPHGQEPLVCQIVGMTNSQGSTWFGGDPFNYSVPLVLAQLIAILAVTRFVWFLLKPCKQGLVCAQLIGGIIMGESFLGRIDAYRDKLFPAGGRLILETFADLGFMFYLFMLGVHIDISLVRKVERFAVVIGAACFMAPLMFGAVGIALISHSFQLDTSVKQSFPIITNISAVTSFPVITCLLADLNILNSEIGRLATLSALVCDICNYTLSLTFRSVTAYLTTENLDVIWGFLVSVMYCIIIVFGLCPIITFIARRVPEGGQIKESQFVVTIVIVLICGLGSEVLGQASALGTFVLGISIPSGFSLGSSVVNKLDTITTEMLVPAKFVISGLSLDIFSIRGVSGAAYGLLIFSCYTGKFTGVLFASLYYELPPTNAVSLALILCCKGAIEAALYITLHEDGMISREAYALLSISMLIVTGIARPLIALLYDPSTRYLGQHKNSVMFMNHPNDELRMLVCIHNAENVPTFINLLDVSSPMINRPIALLVLNLTELLKGRGAAVLESTTNRKSMLTSSRSWSKQAANAFNSFAQKYQGSVIVRHFISVAPYASMHDDICTLAADQDVNIVIVPFHKQWAIDGSVEANYPSIRMVNQNLLTKSPCSVGILIDRGRVTTSHFVVKGHPFSQICLIFLGGLDDCEALAYCSRFIENQEICLTLVWVRPWDQRRYDDDMETEQIKQFRAKTIGDERFTFKEELVKDAIGTTRVIGSIKDYGYDLCVVGRFHDPDSPLLLGLNAWSECPELGVIGDMLATSDFQFSVLVVQQQPPGGVADNRPLPPINCSYISSAHYSDFQDDQSTDSSVHRVIV